MNPMIVYVAIGVAFLINLIITLAFRIADKKDRTLKNVNTQIRSFRTEVSTVVSRINTTVKDCEVNIQSRVDQANSSNSMLAESLEMLMVHQKELSDLEYICKSYESALEKLKIQTEQAEARILAVQAEVRKTDEINSKALEYQAEAEKTKNQMQDIRADYIHLVSTTEQELRNSAQRQIEENSKNLEAFGQVLDRFRVEINDFANNEKVAIQEMFDHQESVTKDACGKIEALGDDIRQSLDAGVKGLDEYSKTLEDSTALLEEKRTGLSQSASEILDKFKSDFESIGESTSDTIEKDIRDREEELSASFDELKDKLEAKEAEIASLLEKIDTNKALALTSLDSSIENKKKEIELSLASMDTSIENKKKEIDSSIASIGNEKDIFISRCRDAMNKEIEVAAESSERQVQTIRELGNKLVESLSDKISQTKEAYESLSEVTAEKISAGIRELSDLEEKIKSANSTHNAIVESTTEKRKELFDLNNNIHDAENKLDKIASDMRKAKEDAQRAKEDRINEEARVVRLKFQQSSMKKEIESADEKPIEAKPRQMQKSGKKKPEEMIEAFPDDIEEFIDISDDDD